MNKILNTLKQKNITLSLLYFYVHFITDAICFFYLAKVYGNSKFIWMIPFVYDGLAFVPQSLIGYYSDKHPKVNIGLIGIFLFVLSIMIFEFTNFNIYISVLIISLANCCMHIDGAEETLKKSNGKLSHPAIFVSGGSFGVTTGKLLGIKKIPAWLLIPISLTMIPFVFLGHTYEGDKDASKYDIINKKINKSIIIIIAVLVVIVRGYMGYGIPTSWNKTVVQNILFYIIMGLGKALGGILSDTYGPRKTAIFSTLLAIPFLSFGDNIMIISIIGVMCFSMTMAITLGILASCLPKTPGLAFGLTTIGLFLGTVPIFFYKITSTNLNIIMICILSIVCCTLLGKVLRKDKI